MLFSYGVLDTPWVSEYTLLSCIFASSECNHTKENRMGDVYSKHTNITFGWLGFIWGNCYVPKWCWMVSEQKCFQPQIGHTCQSPCGIKSLFLSFLQLHTIVTMGYLCPLNVRTENLQIRSKYCTKMDFWTPLTAKYLISVVYTQWYIWQWLPFNVRSFHG